MKCLKPGGYCILHYANDHQSSNDRDPFGATLEEYREMIADLGFVIEDETEVETPRKKVERYGRLLWIQNHAV
jgi:hypothetical protein